MTLTQMSPTVDRIIALLADEFQVDPTDLNGSTAFETLGFDSLVIVELALVLEDALGVALEADELRAAATIADAADLIITKASTP